jgi:hypothetical protein
MEGLQRLSLSGSTLLARVAMNPACTLQAAMALDRQHRTEKEFFQAVAGEPFAGEFGERDSARRRGSKFERNLLQPPGDARLLREAVAPILGVAPDAVTIRDLDNEQPGGAQSSRVKRVGLTRNLLKTALTSAPTALVIVKPTLVLNTGISPHDLHWRYIEPDFVFWDFALGCYVPGDFKSFVVRDGVVPGDKLERVRLQLGCDVVALRDEMRLVSPGLEQRLTPTGYLVFATPYGLKPDTPRREDLSGAVPMILKAIDSFKRHREHVLELAAGAPIVTTVPDLAINYQEKCIAACILAQHCRGRIADDPALLGDVARDLLGRDIALPRLAALMHGAEPADENEARAQRHLHAAAGMGG